MSEAMSISVIAVDLLSARNEDIKILFTAIERRVYKYFESLTDILSRVEKR